MAATESRRLVFTDLDGSLLDHHDYGYQPARPRLAELEAAGVPVIPATSKTRVEIEDLRDELGNGHPFIVENGAAVFIPAGYFPVQPPGSRPVDGYWVYEMSRSRGHWLDLLARLDGEFTGEFECFHRAGPGGIVAMTGLDMAGAERANQREYSEPVQWRGGDERRAAFVSRLIEGGASVLQGGRFLSVSGDCDKGRALAWLRGRYVEAWGQAVVALAAGDSLNDCAMLEAADTALVIRSPVHDYPPLMRREGVLYSEQAGPAGWAEGVGRWLAGEAAAGAEQ